MKKFILINYWILGLPKLMSLVQLKLVLPRRDMTVGKVTIRKSEPRIHGQDSSNVTVPISAASSNDESISFEPKLVFEK